MRIPNPEDYVGKKVRIYFPDGVITEGEFIGYDYDYDDDDNEVLEIDVDSTSGVGYSLTENEIERIEVL